MNAGQIILNENGDYIVTRKQRQRRKSKLGNLFKANVVFLDFHFDVNIHDPLLTQYLIKRYAEDVFSDSTVHTPKCYVNESDPGYILQEQVQDRTSNIRT